MCLSDVMSPEGRSHPAHMPPTEGQLLLFSHTWHHTSFPVCLPSHEEGPTSPSALSHCSGERSDSQGRRAALWRPGHGCTIKKKDRQSKRVKTSGTSVLLVQPSSWGSVGRRLKPCRQSQLSDPSLCVREFAGQGRHPSLSLVAL